MGKKININRYKCACCGACIAVCNFDANEIINTFLVIKEKNCTLCFSCVKACPFNAIEMEE
jgi:ferredoxin